MKKYKDFFDKYNIKPTRYEIVGKATIVDSDSGKFVIKNKNIDNSIIYDYLQSRNFDYYPKIINDNEEYYVSEYIESSYTPAEQKISDMIDLVSLLHNKTTHYKEVDEDDFKKIYEDIKNNIYYLNSYYDDIMTIIESKIYMSPSEYLLARNISKIYESLSFCDRELEEWYSIVKEKRKQRLVVLHNNLDLTHFIKNRESYLINWEKSKFDIPIFDIYKLYRKVSLDVDFNEVFKRYEKNYPLLEEERKLFFILIALPDKIEFNENNYNMCKFISNRIDFIYKTESFISPYYSEKRENN